MSLDENIDALAFGAKTQKYGACLGLYLSPDTIYIGETHLDKAGKLVVDHLVRIPIPQAEAAKGVAPGTQAGSATLNTDFLNDNAKLTALIRQSMSQIRWGTKDVIVTLSHHLGLLRYFAMPAIDRRFWRSSVPLEAKKYIPIPFDVLDHDFQVMPLPPDAQNKPRQGALVAVTQKKNLANIKALLEALGLRLAGIELAPCSVLRVWETIERPVSGKTHAQVHFDGGNIRILVADRGLPVFFREVFLSQAPTLGDIRKIDVAGCVGFAQKQLAVGPLAQLRVSGNVQGLPQWGEALGQEAGAKAAIQDTPAMLGIKGGDWGGYAAIGAALRYLSTSATTLDLAAIGRITEEERRTAKDIFILAGAVAGFFALSGLFTQFMCSQKQKELRRLRRDADIEAIFAGKDASEIERIMEDMRKHLDMLPRTDGPKTLDLLKEMVDYLPEKAWITKLSMIEPLQKQANLPAELHITGNATGPSLVAEQDLAFAYKNALASSALIGKRYPDLQVSVQARQNTDNSGMDQAQLQASLEQRTGFTINAFRGKR